jgi:hypothetical protein
MDGGRALPQMTAAFKRAIYIRNRYTFINNFELPDMDIAKMTSFFSKSKISLEMLEIIK